MRQGILTLWYPRPNFLLPKFEVWFCPVMLWAPMSLSVRWMYYYLYLLLSYFS